MKQIKYNTVLLIKACTIVLTIISCNDNDFLNRSPFGQLDENNFFVKAEDANLAAIACYEPLQKPNLHWASAQLELGMSDDFSPQGFNDASPFYGATFNPNENSVIRGIWVRSFQGIALCNNSIASVKAMSSSVISEADKNKYLAEMKFIRAFWYFRLIRFYGDVPLRTKPIKKTNDSKEFMLPRTNHTKIISDLIIPDFTFAANNLPAFWDTKNKKRATKSAAHAFLTEVYIYIDNYEKAIEQGTQVDKFGHFLLDDPNKVLRVDYEGNPEIIFAIGYTNGVETYREYYYGTVEDLGDKGRIMRGNTYSGGYFYPSKNLIDFYRSIDGKSIDESPFYNKAKAWQYRDPRFDTTYFTIMDEIETTTGVQLNWQKDFLINKQTGFDIQKRGVWYGEDTWNRYVDYVYMRLPRVYLLLAEAYAKKGDFTNANHYVNMTRKRARNFALSKPEKYIPKGLGKTNVLPPFKVSNLEEALKAIDYEMRVELFTEDVFRYFDLKRWGTLSKCWSLVGGFTWEDKFLNLPIPTSELSANTEMTQNPGW
ncbi:MAG: RagB/SusD family nutrient uptake outer membrane protein [Tenacibaculum sp.]